MNINQYKIKIQKLVNEIDENFINLLVNKIKSTKKKGGKVFIVGNGGSISTAAHISVDLTKNAKIKTFQPYNDNLITCYANDYGYEKWVSKAIDHFLNFNDLVIFLSVSGNSKNLVNAANTCKKKGISLVSLTGLSKKNKLNKISKIKYWVNSKSYNQVETIHFLILAIVVDKIVGRDVYGTNL